MGSALGKKFLDLPNEVIFKILEHSQLDDVIALALTNRRMNSVAGSHFLDIIDFNCSPVGNSSLTFGGERGIPFSACDGLVKLLDWRLSPPSSLRCCFTERFFREEIQQLLPVISLLPTIHTLCLTPYASRNNSKKLRVSGQSNHPSGVKESMETLLAEIVSKHCRVFSLGQLIIPIQMDRNSSNSSSDLNSITAQRALSALEEMVCWSPWMLIGSSFQQWFIGSCNKSKIRRLSLVYIPQTPGLLRDLCLPHLEELTLAFEPSSGSESMFSNFPSPSPSPFTSIPTNENVNGDASTLAQLADPAYPIPGDFPTGFPTALVDRGISGFFIHHSTITYLDIAMVSHLFIFLPSTPPLPSTVLPNLKSLRVHIHFLSYLFSSPASLPGLEKLDISVESRPVAYGRASNTHFPAYRVEDDLGALSNHAGCIKELHVSLILTRASPRGRRRGKHHARPISGFFSSEDSEFVLSRTVERVEIRVLPQDVTQLTNEPIHAWVGNVLPCATEFCIGRTDWDGEERRSFISSVASKCSSIRRVGIDGVTRSMGQWLALLNTRPKE
ncbi:hypothetical protein D9758_016385 [Tetrapyrgos nigripes]|uniref:F-box domain-containing protein n=1 Tax=Tetrapyrgos nigripes TaxID=182062 RepID=A0A8H5C7M6_9AGAR|nr:hypothetical protein D9758_016385 [Tetrapyrgos nigripes]